MKLVSYRPMDNDAMPWRAGLLVDQAVIDINWAMPDAPSTVLELLQSWAVWQPALQALSLDCHEYEPLSLEQVRLGSPLTRPNSFRDFYAFEAHVKTARARRGLDMVPEWYQFPVFYFSNASAFLGPEEPVVKPKATEWLDYELEVACVIGKGGIDIAVEDAEEHIAGFCILNDWSARDLQREEVKVGLGPAKGKDFATSMGPYLVTLDELEDVRTVSASGSRFNLPMIARVNGNEYSRGSLGDIHYTFAQLVAHASADCMLHPGDVLGSGTVGTGCILELGTERYDWLKPGDVVELEVERLGILRNTVIAK
ncbi:fumarylacetoacetate hydrolase family protein [Brevibacillus fluminis]|uniref:fumarylacetoacetate hydrolase family protein n=1 Tax=Brevibacillus fluminis TaxID=511487 RepID=UPI003F88A74D